MATRGQQHARTYQSRSRPLTQLQAENAQFIAEREIMREHDVTRVYVYSCASIASACGVLDIVLANWKRQK